jgi:hypothetical protein
VCHDVDVVVDDDEDDVDVDDDADDDDNDEDDDDDDDDDDVDKYENYDEDDLSKCKYLIQCPMKQKAPRARFRFLPRLFSLHLCVINCSPRCTCISGM